MRYGQSMFIWQQCCVTYFMLYNYFYNTLATDTPTQWKICKVMGKTYDATSNITETSKFNSNCLMTV